MQASSEWTRVQLEFLRELMSRNREQYERITEEIRKAAAKGQEM